jgi:AraC-like DNA-binding protein
MAHDGRIRSLECVVPPDHHHCQDHGLPGEGANAFTMRSLRIEGNLHPFVRALVAVKLDGTGPLPLSIAPHESMVLSVQLGNGVDCIDEKGDHGELTHLTGIRESTGNFMGAGNCTSLIALLTPLGVVKLLDSQAVAPLPRIRARVDELLDRQVTRQLESDIALAQTLDDKLSAFAAWLEARANVQRGLARPALRAARAAMRLSAEPTVPMETLADEQHVSRRQIERDFGHWIGTSPRHLARVVRLQAVSRLAQTGASMADIAADIGYTDQAHMSRVVKELTGLTPTNFVKCRNNPLANAFRRATAGGTVYL